MWTAPAAAIALIGALVVAGGAAPAAADPSYPSWDDVQAAKANAANAQAEVDRINGLLASLQTAANAAGDLAVKRAGEYGSAEAALQAATQKADDLSTRATAAADQAATLRTQSGTLASQLARAGGSDVSLQLFLGGSTSNQESLLYTLGAMSKLTERSTALLAAADQQKNLASALSAQASAAEAVRTKLDADAKKALEAAKQAEAAAEAQLADQKTHADTLYAQLATLKNTEASTERDYAAGEAAKAAAEAAANPGGGSDGFAPPPGMVVDPAAAQAYAASRLSAYGWGGDQMGCLIKLWNHESGWRADAYNTSSGAYGIPQAWPASKLSSAGADWMTNANTQINWGLDYIDRAYGSPCAAWNFEMSHDPNWY
jgi:peptidoglycan DL-endopeptidase CwlO